MSYNKQQHDWRAEVLSALEGADHGLTFSDFTGMVPSNPCILRSTLRGLIAEGLVERFEVPKHHSHGIRYRLTAKEAERHERA